MINPPVEKRLTEKELSDVHKAFRRIKEKIGDADRRNGTPASSFASVLSDFDENTPLIKDVDLTNPFSAPDKGDETAQKVGGLRATTNGAVTAQYHEIITACKEQKKCSFGIKDNRIQDVFYNIIEEIVIQGHHAYQDFFLDAQITRE